MLKQNTKVRVYKNLQTSTWTIQTKQGKNWKKYCSLNSCTITNATPKVSRSGVERIRRRKRRTVIAMIEGYFLEDHVLEHKNCKEVHYNPYKNYDFYYKDNQTFQGCDIAIFPTDCSHFKEGI